MNSANKSTPWDGIKITDESLLNDERMSQHLKEFYQFRLNELGSWEKVYGEAELLFVDAENYEAAAAIKKCKEFHINKNSPLV